MKRPPMGTDTEDPVTDPLFSVIVPTYNHAASLGQSIRSVLEQSCDDFELIVVNDGSTDDTVELLSSFADARLRVIHQDRCGRSAARNAGASIARGQYLTFLDSDDHALPHWLERMATVIRSSASPIVCCGARFADGKGPEKILLPYRRGPVLDYEVALFLAGTFVVLRDLFESVGGYDPVLEQSENTELAFRLASRCRSNGWSIADLQEPLVVVHRMPPKASLGQMVSMTHVVEKHWAELKTQPGMLANTLASVGVCAARIGHYREARRSFRRAIAVFPFGLRNYGRLLVSSVPPLAERTWGRVA
jgi:glycosyltransferase involved in cell wall biosynthesis